MIGIFCTVEKVHFFAVVIIYYFHRFHIGKFVGKRFSSKIQELLFFGNGMHIIVL